MLFHPLPSIDDNNKPVLRHARGLIDKLKSAMATVRDVREGIEALRAADSIMRARYGRSEGQILIEMADLGCWCGNGLADLEAGVAEVDRLLQEAGL